MEKTQKMNRGTFYLHYYDIDDVTSARMLEKIADLGKENFITRLIKTAS